MSTQLVRRTNWVGFDERTTLSVEPCLTHWPLGDLDAILKLQFSILFCWLVSSDLLMIMHLYGCHGTSTDDKSTLVQVMAWCRQATSHYLSQCWPSSMSPYGVTRPQWVKENFHSNFPEHCSWWFNWQCINMWQHAVHYDVTWFEYISWHHTIRECIMNIHCKNWIQNNESLLTSELLGGFVIYNIIVLFQEQKCQI